MPNSKMDMVSQVQFLFPFKSVDEGSVQAIIDPVYVRTTKDELGLRKPDRLMRNIKMSDAQSEFYQLIASEEARQLSKLRARDRIQLRTLGRSVIRLLQAASNPVLLLNATNLPQELVRKLTSEDDSPKIQFACERARQLAKANGRHVDLAMSDFRRCSKYGELKLAGSSSANTASRLSCPRSRLIDLTLHSATGRRAKTAIFPNNFNPIIPVQSSAQKYFTSNFQKFMFLSAHPASLGGAARDRHGRWKQDAVDVRMFSARRRADENSFTDERRRVGLAP